MIGKTISHYRITEKLGAGGMGIVYKAEDLKLGRMVALKFLPPELTRDEEAKIRFISEAKTASSLDHNNICTIHEIDEADGQLFICMTYYEGETLKNKISAGPLNTEEAISIATQIAGGLETAHKKGIVHRDIKPANIFITDNGIVKILDFGLAKLGSQNQMTRPGSIIGTASYMSPEQAMGENVDHRTDIWSLGVVFYEMITGRLPFKGEYDQSMIFSILNDEIPMTDIPPEFIQVIEVMLKKEPAKRFANCREVIEGFNKNAVSRQTAEQKTGPSIAVLPFVNMSADPANEYFSDGLSEDIINSLTKINNFRVVARTSSFSFKGTNTDIREIGKKLNVEAILEGSIRKSGNRLRITAQLVNTKEGYHLWSEQFNRVMDDVFTIQDEITTAIVEKLKGELIGEDKDNLVKKTARNYEAYNFYLKGRYLLNKRTENTIKQSITFFEQAIEQDPMYAPAYAGLADSYNMLGAGDYGIIPPGEAFPKAKKAAEKALKLDNSLAEAYTALGWALVNYDWDFKGGEKTYKRAIELNPGYATAHQVYAIYLSIIGNHALAVKEATKASELDPLSLIINSDVAWVLHRAREYDAAIRQCQKTLSIDPSFSVTHWNLGRSYLQKGIHNKAIEELQKAVNHSEGNTVFLAALGYAYAVAGKRNQAIEILEKLNLMSANKYIQPHLMALIYVGLGDHNQAFEWLDKAVKDRTDFIIEAREDPALDNLRNDPRFKAVIEKTGIYQMDEYD